MGPVFPEILKPIQAEIESGDYNRETIYTQLVAILSRNEAPGVSDSRSEAPGVSDSRKEYKFGEPLCVDGIWLLKLLFLDIERRNGSVEFDSYLKRISEEKNLKESMKSEFFQELEFRLS